MAISPSFSVSQSAITTSNVTVQDTSTGTYDTITQRRITIQFSDGTYLTGNGTINYDAWALADNSYTNTGLTQDVAVNIKVEWLNVSNVVVDTLNDNYPLAEFGKQFFYYLVQLQGLKPTVIQDTNYSRSMEIFWVNVVGGINAATNGNDIAAGQNCFNRETEMRLKQNIFFT